MPRLVNIVDDSEKARAATSFLLHRRGYEVQVHASGREFLARRNIDRGCVLLNVSEPGMNSLDVLAELKTRGVDVPVIILSRPAGISGAVLAMKRGAADFIELPFADDILTQAIEEALLLSNESLIERDVRSRSAARLEKLTPRESQILQALCEDMPNKIIARRLALSPRTVETYRANMMYKLGATRLAQALRIASDANFRGPPVPIAPEARAA